MRVTYSSQCPSSKSSNDFFSPLVTIGSELPNSLGIVYGWVQHLVISGIELAENVKQVQVLSLFEYKAGMASHYKRFTLGCSVTYELLDYLQRFRALHVLDGIQCRMPHCKICVGRVQISFDKWHQRRITKVRHKI